MRDDITITGKLSPEWHAKLQQVKPTNVTVNAFVTTSIKAVISSMLSGVKFTPDAYELEQLRVENNFLKNEIKLLAKKVGVM